MVLLIIKVIWIQKLSAVAESFFVNRMLFDFLFYIIKNVIVEKFTQGNFEAVAKLLY